MLVQGVAQRGYTSILLVLRITKSVPPVGPRTGANEFHFRQQVKLRWAGFGQIRLRWFELDAQILRQRGFALSN